MVSVMRQPNERRRLAGLAIAVVLGVLLLSAQRVQPAPRGVQRLAEHCRLAGVLSESGDCLCLPGWEGPRCGRLKLRPARSVQNAQAYPPAGEGRATWGASVVEHEGKWHMLVSAFEGGLLLGQGWAWNSTIEHAVSDSALGPFYKVGVALEAEAHNPSLTRAPDGRWLLYHIGKRRGDPASCPAFPSGIGDIGVAHSESLDGPWHVRFPIVPHPGDVATVGPRWDNWLQNPEPIIHQDGKVTLIVNSIMHNNTDHRSPQWHKGFSHRAIAYATADRWDGDYKLHEHLWPVKGFEKESWAEDPFIFQQRGAWHILTHKWYGRCQVMDPECPCSGHAYSRSLKGPWTLSTEPPFPRHIPLRGGGRVELRRRERPRIVFDAQGNPRYFYTGVQPIEKNSFSYTAVQEFDV
eukprot:TRINITY_DN11615_c0_g1_i1.p1 TRINITY_DN11615_c0_g1~~TRINITY_DN11615_c0_g1_i1.p1  ORF type:complete len:447 (+),score=130.53 TRINITY_DN11615_c0_g1_i1:120-1343(+)